MRHRATQLILPFEPALPGRQLILAPRLWPTMTPTTQQQLAKRVAQLLRSMLAAADAGNAVVLAFCWAHWRRRFYEIARAGSAPIAEEALRRIAGLYKIEAEIRGRSAAERREVRQAESKPLVAELKGWLTAARACLR